MAQDAELRLKVGLDLAFFKQQLADLGSAAAGYRLPITVQFKPKSIQDELKKLNKINATIKVDDSQIDAARSRVGTLNKSLATLRKATATPIEIKLKYVEVNKPAAANQINRAVSGGVLGAQTLEGLKRSQLLNIRKMMSEVGMALGEITNLTKATVEELKASIIPAFTNSGEEAINGFAAGLADSSSKISKIAAKVGIEAITGIKGALGIKSPSKEFEKIGKNVGEGFEKGALSSMDNAFDALESKIRQRGKILDTIARGIFNMLGMDSAAMLQQARQKRLPPSINWPAQVPSRTPPIGPSSSGRALPFRPDPKLLAGEASPALAGLLPSLTLKSKLKADFEAFMGLGGGPPSAGQGPGKLALSSEALGRRVGAILEEYFKVAEVSVRTSFDPRELRQSLNVFSYIAQSLRDAEARTRQAKVDQSVNSLMNAIEQSIKTAEASARIRLAQIRELPQRPSQPMLQGAPRVAGLLLPEPPGRYRSSRAVETQADLFARREREARMRSALREQDVMGGGAGRPAAPYSYAYRSPRPRSAMVPYGAGGALVATGGGGAGAPPVNRPPSGGMGGFGGAGGFGRALAGVNLPGAGVVREIGNEFAMATKQVLLFGTAYKALAFATSFPAQVGEAVGALQSFNNTLKAITPTAQEAAASNQFILDIVDRYNVPLQSARDGFTKLYASMAPAGFKGDEIRALFTGVSQAAATFGMSADKVDRVNYAFAQMASKGQVMSEELKGQLGDVLPGAMGIFAEAAGFEGPQAIEKFSKALEDGAYKGDSMRALLRNVTVILTKEFGPGAEGAARTFQGVINRMQNSTKLLYEAFEPVAVGFLNAVVVPMTSGIKVLSDGFSAFFKGVNAQTTGGFAIAKELERLRPAFEGIRANVVNLLPTLQSLGEVLLGVSKAFLQIASNPFVGYLAKVYINVLALSLAIQVLNLRALIPMIANFARSAVALIAFTAQCARAGQSAQVMGLMVRTAGLTLRTFFASSGVGLVLVGVGLLIEKFISMNQALENTKRKAQDAGQSIRAMSQIEARQAAQRYTVSVRNLQQLNKQIEEGQMKGKAWIEVTKWQADALKEAGVTVSDVKGSLQVQPERVPGAFQRLQQLEGEAVYTERLRKFESQQGQAPAPLSAMPPSDGANAKADQAAAKEAERLANRQQQNDIDAANRQNALARSVFDGKIALNNLEFEHFKKLEEARYNLQMAGLNSIQARQLQHQQELQKLEIQRVETVRQARERAARAVLDYEAARNTATVAGAPAMQAGGIQGGQGVFDSGMRTGPSHLIGGSAEYHQDIMFGSTVSMKERVQLMDQLAKGYEALGRVIEFSNTAVQGERYRSSMSYDAKASLITRAQAAHASRSGGSGRAAMDFYGPLASSTRFGESVVGQAMLAPVVPGANYQHGGGGKGGRTMTATRNGAMVYEMLHGSMGVPLQARTPSRSAAINTMQRREDKAGGTLQVESQQQLNQSMESGLNIRQSTIEAIEQTKALIAGNLATIYPIAEQHLENDLLKIRNNLQMQGMNPEYIDLQLKIAKADMEGAIALKDYKGKLDNAAQALAVMQQKKKDGTALTQAEADLYGDVDNAIVSLTGDVKNYGATVQALPERQRQFNDSLAQGYNNARDLSVVLSEINRTGQRAGLGLSAGFRGEAGRAYEDAIKDKRTPEEAKQIAEATENTSRLVMVATELENVFNNVGSAFGDAFQKMISGSATAKEALAGLFQSISDSFAGMVAKMIAEWTQAQLVKGFQSIAGMILGPIAGGITGGLGSLVSSAAGFGGNFDAGIAPLSNIPNYSGAFATAANGAVWQGGFQAFASGGIVTGPTMGLVGEGRYNEAIVPLPDGKSIPVDLGGGAGASTTNVIVNVDAKGTNAQGNEDVARQLGGVISVAVQSEIVRQQRPGGLLASSR